MVTGRLWAVDGVEHYRIDRVDEMAPFLTTVVSVSDLWMFVSSTGALTAGRVDPDHAIFPYETDDRLHRAVGNAGPVTIVARSLAGRREIWRPFGRETAADRPRAIAKSVLGDRLVFEERHEEWSLTYRMTWASSDRHGWVRTIELIDHSGQAATFEVLDGLLDVMPAGVDALTEQIRSNLADAYKRSELHDPGTVAIYSLEAAISDRAEPAESLTATCVWSAGFPGDHVDLAGDAVDAMLHDRPRTAATLVTGRPGAYLRRGRVEVPGGGSAGWTMVADTGLDHAAVEDVIDAAASPTAIADVEADVRRGSDQLRILIGGADAHQSTGDPVADAHHLSNVLFNSMRGGVFPSGHHLPVADVVDFVGSRNRPVLERHRTWFGVFGDHVDVDDLRDAARATGDPDLERLVLEYLPLTFSRRHGDPSRPWNRFSIHVRDDHGDAVLAYEGNWRDIFQNWEALLRSYPAYFANVVAKFVNATTLEGYNAYRISRAGIDWEVPDPSDPWSHIGYWGDHQIVYLMRLLEAWEDFEPGAIDGWLTRPLFTFAEVPYVMADHEAIVDDPRDTITYDAHRAAVIAEREQRIGADGRLLPGPDGDPLRAGLLEKLIVPALAKLANFVPGGGIWLNTQRPEWNDANNALAGPGLSMVTTYHLRRYVDLLRTFADGVDAASTPMTESVATWLADVSATLGDHDPDGARDDEVERRAVLDALGRGAAAHRARVAREHGLGVVAVDIADVRRLCAHAADHLEATIRSAQRDDGLYHSYNRLSFPDRDRARVDHLGPMLEGQVAVLSSGRLRSADVQALVGALYASDLYRPDQDTFLLYPATRLPSFLRRNVVPDEAVRRLRELGDDARLDAVLTTDRHGRLHFRADLVNAKALEDRLDRTGFAEPARSVVLDAYEQVFQHRSFTGRSGTMYGYEGLGSVYWHMVAKLLLAVQESYWAALDAGESDATLAGLAGCYRRIRAGFGFAKAPDEFGAFPTDCYSHTPAHAGAQQPGMTGQVKEEVITRFGELGLRVVNGAITLAPGLLPPGEVFPVGADGEPKAASLTMCAVPVAIVPAERDQILVETADGGRDVVDGVTLTPATARAVFAREGAVTGVEWHVGAVTMARWASLGSDSS